MMKKLFVVLFCLVTLTGCGSDINIGDGVAILLNNATGTWVGDVNYTAYGSKNVTLILNQSGSKVSGIYIGDDGTQDFSGTITENKVQFTLTPAQCEGARTGTITISLNTGTGKFQMAYSVSGSYSCSGPAVNTGTGTLTRQ
jgi:hypothetical protein